MRAIKYGPQGGAEDGSDLKSRVSGRSRKGKKLMKKFQSVMTLNKSGK